MMRRILILLLLITAMVVVVHAEQPSLKLVDAYWGGGTTEVSELRTLIAVVEYSGDEPLVNLTASLDTRPLGGDPPTAKITCNFTITSGQRVYLNFTFRAASERLALSHAYLPLSVRGRTPSGAEVVLNTTLVVAVRGEPNIEVRLDRDEVQRGGTTRVSLIVENTGDGPARELEVRVRPESAYVTVLGANVFEIGMLAPGSRVEIPVELLVGLSAPDELCLAVELGYADQYQRRWAQTVELGLRTRAPPGPALVVQCDQTTVEPGVKNTIALRVCNVGSAEAVDVVLKIMYETGPLTILGSGVWRLGDIAPGEAVRVLVDVVPSATSLGPASLRILLSYEDPYGAEHAEETLVGLWIEREPRPHLRLILENPRVMLGSLTNVTIKVINAGSTTAKNVLIDLMPSAQVSLADGGRYVIDELPPGELKVLKLSVYVPREPAGALWIDARLSYEDDRGRRFEDYTRLSLVPERGAAPCLAVCVVTRTLIPDHENEVRLVVTNNGTAPAYNVTLSLITHTQLAAVLGSGRRVIAVLPPGASWEARFTIYVQPQVYGALQFYIIASYEDAYGQRYLQGFPLGMLARGLGRLAISKVILNPPIVLPGDPLVTVNVVISNIGDYVCKDLKLRLLPVNGVIEPAYAGSDEATIPYLPTGQAVTVTFLVRVDEAAKPGCYKLPLVVRGVNVVNQTLEVPVTIHERLKLHLELLRAEPTPKPGSRGVRLWVLVRNVSNATADDLRLELISPYLSGSRATYVGSLGPGAAKCVMFEVDVSEETPPGLLDVEVSASWTQDKRPLMDAFHLGIPVSPRPSLADRLKAHPAWVAAALVALAAAAVSWRLLVRRT